MSWRHDEGDGVLRSRASAGALRPWRPAGQGPRPRGHAPLQESHWPGQYSCIHLCMQLFGESLWSSQWSGRFITTNRPSLSNNLRTGSFGGLQTHTKPLVGMISEALLLINILCKP